jgi:ATP/maltotriose-dependent transcriptional regulator MalT
MDEVGLEGAVTQVARVRPPLVRRDLVSRPRLLDLLESGAGRRLTLVSAPAGFGKTTLLAEWASTAGRPVAWLTLDEEDGDPAIFWGNVAESFGHAVPGFRPAGPAALGGLRRPVALVLDDYEQIADAPSNESVSKLVGEAPPTLRIVLSGRVDPPFPLEALRARGEVLEIGTGDLRMTDVEAAELLHRAAGGSLAVREVQRQIARSEGRPAALCLVAYSPAAEGAGARPPAPRDVAVEQALHRGDFAEAGRTIVRSWRRLVDAGGQARVLGWIERLPRELVDADPRLGLVRAWLLRLEGRRDESDRSLDAASRSARTTEARAAVERESVLLRAAVPWDNVGATLALAQRARRSERSGTGRSVAAWALGSAYWWSGDLDVAADALADALRGPLVVRCAAQALLARIAVERGAQELATALARTADRTLRENGLAGLRELGMVATALGAAEAARSPGSGALAQLERGVRLRRAWGHPLETADALIAAAPTAAAVVGRRQAATMLGEARRLVAGCSDPGALAERLSRAHELGVP